MPELAQPPAAQRSIVFRHERLVTLVTFVLRASNGKEIEYMLQYDHLERVLYS